MKNRYLFSKNLLTTPLIVLNLIFTTLLNACDREDNHIKVPPSEKKAGVIIGFDTSKLNTAIFTNTHLFVLDQTNRECYHRYYDSQKNWLII